METAHCNRLPSKQQDPGPIGLRTLPRAGAGADDAGAEVVEASVVADEEEDKADEADEADGGAEVPARVIQELLDVHHRTRQRTTTAMWGRVRVEEGAGSRLDKAQLDHPVTASLMNLPENGRAMKVSRLRRPCSLNSPWQSRSPARCAHVVKRSYAPS